MTTEEKARAYDEAIEKAKYYYEKGYAMINAALVNIFPELKESEDEKIRKTLIRIFTANNVEDYGWVTNKQIVEWLEKQGESYTKKDVDDAWLKGICDAKRELEKQGELQGDEKKL